MSACVIRPARPGDEADAYRVCLRTGDHGRDAEPLYRDDPDALGRIFVGPYLALEPDSSLVIEDHLGVAGYALAALDSQSFYARYDAEWRPVLCERFPHPTGDQTAWTPAQQVHYCYHHPDYFCPEPYDAYPSHLHIDLLPRVQGQGHGRAMIGQLVEWLARRGSPGVHLGVSALNLGAHAFYVRLGFRDLIQVGRDRDAVIYMGMQV